jgi:hypothetical protein
MPHQRVTGGFLNDFRAKLHRAALTGADPDTSITTPARKSTRCPAHRPRGGRIMTIDQAIARLDQLFADALAHNAQTLRDLGVDDAIIAGIAGATAGRIR